VNYVRRIFLAMPFLWGLVLALSPMYEMDANFDGIFLHTISGISILQIPVDLDSASEHEHQNEHRHEHANYDDCHNEAGHCAPGVPVINVDSRGAVAVSSAQTRQMYDDALPAGLQPLPLLPPPEQV